MLFLNGFLNRHCLIFTHSYHPLLPLLDGHKVKKHWILKITLIKYNIFPESSINEHCKIIGIWPLLLELTNIY